ncbi:hypothetical protein GQ607_015742 [Colletotrichum asianum]|uniref:Uncharacterized protein n=1 Tax=Colletotrichum asianum TaxID=702518 RepID=A0A8H3ZMH4_9PEZI|nr:hypothetical protein GQ607_015742 [Colletotrichum asianum]
MFLSLFPVKPTTSEVVLVEESLIALLYHTSTRDFIQPGIVVLNADVSPVSSNNGADFAVNTETKLAGSPQALLARDQ